MDDKALLKWVCAQLGELDGWSWEPDEIYDCGPDLVTVHAGAIPHDARRAVGVHLFGGSDDKQTSTKTRRAQTRARGAEGDPYDAGVLADAAHSHFEELLREGVISSVERTSFGPAGTDKNGRYERTDSYLIIFDNPEA